MASSSVLQQLAKKSPQYKAALLALTLVVLGFLYYQVRYSDLSDQSTELDNRKNSLNSQQHALDEKLSEMDDLLDKKAKLEKSIKDMDKALPTQAELPAFFDHLQKKAGDTGVTIRKWENMDQIPVEKYVRVPVKLEVVGTFYQITHYFAALGPPQRDLLQEAADGEDAGPRIDERIVSIENLELTQARLQDGDIVVTGTFVVSTFRQGDKPEPPAAKKAKPKTPAKTPAKAGATPAATKPASTTPAKPQPSPAAKPATPAAKPAGAGSPDGADKGQTSALPGAGNAGRESALSGRVLFGEFIERSLA